MVECYFKYKFYIRGQEHYVPQVISHLEKLGGQNKFNLSGAVKSSIYYIDNNIIFCANEDDMCAKLLLSNPDFKEHFPAINFKFKVGYLVKLKGKGDMLFIVKEVITDNPEDKPKEYRAYLVAYMLYNKLTVTEATFEPTKERFVPYINDVLYWTEKPVPPQLF